MACTGLSINDGATNSFSSEYTNKKIAVRKANKTILLVDSSKFGMSTLMTYCPLVDIDYIVTNKMPPDDLTRIVLENGHSIVLCDVK
jgi:DeoR family myo-inositol catabolism operon transcriptional repressor